MEDPSYSEREDAEDGAASQETTPAPARRAVLVKPRALPPPNPPDHGGGRCGRTRRSRSTLRDSAPLFPRVTLSWRPWRWAGQGRPSSPEGPSTPGDSERTRTWAASGALHTGGPRPLPLARTKHRPGSMPRGPAATAAWRLSRTGADDAPARVVWSLLHLPGNVIC